MKKRIAILTLLLLGCFYLAGCFATYSVAVPSAVYAMKAGVSQQEVVFKKIENSIEVEAPREVVWDVITYTKNLKNIYPWLTRINPIGGVEKLTMVGQGIEYYTLLNNRHSSGSAIITYLDHPSQINFTLFGNFRGSQEIRLEPTEEGNCRVLYTWLIEYMEDKSQGPFTEIQQKMMEDRQENMNITLQNIKDFCEGRPLSVEPYKYPPRFYRSREEPVIFDVTKGVVEIQKPLDEVWDNFTTSANFDKFFPWLSMIEPVENMKKVTQTGDMFKFRRSPISAAGIAVVTQYIEKHRIYLSIFGINRGGQEFVFEPLGENLTLFTYTSYIERCEGDRPQAFCERVKEETQQTIEAVKKFNERDLPPVTESTAAAEEPTS